MKLPFRKRYWIYRYRTGIEVIYSNRFPWPPSMNAFVSVRGPFDSEDIAESCRHT